MADEPVSMLDVSLRAGVLRLLAAAPRRARAEPALHHPRPAARAARHRRDPRAQPRPGRRTRPDQAGPAAPAGRLHHRSCSTRCRTRSRPTAQVARTAQRQASRRKAGAEDDFLLAAHGAQALVGHRGGEHRGGPHRDADPWPAGPAATPPRAARSPPTTPEPGPAGGPAGHRPRHLEVLRPGHRPGHPPADGQPHFAAARPPPPRTGITPRPPTSACTCGRWSRPATWALINEAQAKARVQATLTEVVAPAAVRRLPVPVVRHHQRRRA